MKRLFPEGWNPPRKVGREDMDMIRRLQRMDPETWSTGNLANHYKISAEAVRRILKSNYRPKPAGGTDLEGAGEELETAERLERILSFSDDADSAGEDISSLMGDDDDGAAPAERPVPRPFWARTRVPTSSTKAAPSSAEVASLRRAVPLHRDFKLTQSKWR